MTFAPMAEPEADLKEKVELPIVTFESFTRDIALLIATHPFRRNPLFNDSCCYAYRGDHCLFGKWLSNMGVPDDALEPMNHKASLAIRKFEGRFFVIAPGHGTAIQDFADLIQNKADGSDLHDCRDNEPRKPRVWWDLLGPFSWIYEDCKKLKRSGRGA